MKKQHVYSVNRISILLLISLLATSLISCQKNPGVVSGNLVIEFNKQMESRIISLSPEIRTLQDDFMLTETVLTKEKLDASFQLKSIDTKDIESVYGNGKETLLKGTLEEGPYKIEKIISAGSYIQYPDLILFRISYVNKSERVMRVKGWESHNYHILSAEDSPAFWSFQGSSSSSRDDWVLRVDPGFSQDNYMGMNQSDYGGGIPVTDLWRKDAGIAIGHLEPFPREVSLPVDFDAYGRSAEIAIREDFKHLRDWAPGDTLQTIHSFVCLHRGDYYAALEKYSSLLQAGGMQFADSEPAAFESVWCGWGYERKFTTQDIIQTLPKVKELGIQWAVIDDGFQIAEGDWRVDKKRFPGGSKDMKTMVNAIHDHGLKAKLWWAPLAADPGSKVLDDYPDALLINESGSPQYISWWDSYYLSPSSEATLDYTLETVDMFMDDWGFDGLKLDGQHMNAVPADHNWERPLPYPEKSIEDLPGFFETIYNRAREIKPHAVIENCPCGTCMSVYNMPHTNQVVSSDPTSSWQIRLKGKTYKAIMPQTAYYGDHVELSDESSDFASSFGVGAVLGTKFTWPTDNPEQNESQLLTAEKEETWKRWFDLYHQKMLSKESYLGQLYDIGYDKPEAHLIAKNDTLFYAFFSDSWEGEIPLRGLQKELNYRVIDYVNEIDLGKVSGNKAAIKASFEKHLLLSVYPESE